MPNIYWSGRLVLYLFAQLFGVQGGHVDRGGVVVQKGAAALFAPMAGAAALELAVVLLVLRVQKVLLVDLVLQLLLVVVDQVFLGFDGSFVGRAFILLAVLLLLFISNQVPNELTKKTLPVKQLVEIQLLSSCQLHYQLESLMLKVLKNPKLI